MQGRTLELLLENMEKGREMQWGIASLGAFRDDLQGHLKWPILPVPVCSPSLFPAVDSYSHDLCEAQAPHRQVPGSFPSSLPHAVVQSPRTQPQLAAAGFSPRSWRVIKKRLPPSGEQGFPTFLESREARTAWVCMSASWLPAARPALFSHTSKGGTVTVF